MQVWFTSNWRLSLTTVPPQESLLTQNLGLATTGLFHYIYETELELLTTYTFTIITQWGTSCVLLTKYYNNQIKESKTGLRMQNVWARNAHKILVGKPKGNGSYIALEGVEWILIVSWTFGFHEILGIYWVDEQLFISHERLRSMELSTASIYLLLVTFAAILTVSHRKQGLRDIMN